MPVNNIQHIFQTRIATESDLPYSYEDWSETEQDKGLREQEWQKQTNNNQVGSRE